MNMALIDSDIKNRNQALDPTKSFIIQAPAGSGKTELLIQRYLTLLSVVKEPEEILAITFTKKAANEMRVRIKNALQDAEQNTPVTSEHHTTTRNIAKAALKQDERYQWSLLNNPNRMRIQTIDSLCATLTQQMPLLSQIGANASISDAPDLIYRDAVNEALQQVEQNSTWSESIKTLLLHLDNDVKRIHELLIHLLKKRDQWLNYIHLDLKSDHIRALLESELLAVTHEFVVRAKSHLPAKFAEEIFTLGRYAGHNLVLRDSDSPLVNCEDTIDDQDDPELQQAYWMGIADLLLTAKGEWRKQFNVKNGFPAATEFKNPEEKRAADDFKQRAMTLVEKMKDHEAFRSALHEVAELPPTHYTDTEWLILNALFEVLKLCAAQLRIYFQQKGQIDFIENAQAALLALGNDEHPTDLALALDYQIKHILLDEFQDTSYTQFKLLEKLTLGWQADDGRSLFIVGDPMQSIYRFREAEVGLFLSLFERGLNHLPLIPLALRQNFRATPELITWCNKHFTNIFPSHSHIATGAVNYTSSISLKEPNTHSTIEVTEIVDGNDKWQASKIVEKIRIRRASHPEESIAILVRARPHLHAIIPALHAAEIPYEAVDIDPLMSKQYIQDILSLLNALLHPENRVAWLSILRAPWCGLTLADMLLIAGPESKSAIFAKICDSTVRATLSSDGQHRINRIIPILDEGIKDRYRYNLRVWIENIWRKLGGPACVKNQTQLEDVKCLFELLDEMSSSSEPFNLAKLNIKMSSLYAKPLATENAVQLMTIHSAKGLEFDTVFLPHLEKQPAGDKSQLLHWMEYPLQSNRHALILAPIHATADDKNPIYQFISRQQKKRADNEINRLLYVAATRAKKHLYAYFSTRFNDEDEVRIASTSFLSKFQPAFQAEPGSITRFNAVKHIAVDKDQEAPPNLFRVTSNWTHPQSTSLNFTVKEEERRRRAFSLPDYRRKHIGTITHEILQIISLQGQAWWQQQSEQRQQQHIQQHLQRVNYPMQELHEGSVIIKQIIHNVLNDQRGQWILQAHTNAASEYAITLQTSNGVEKFVIDRTFVDETGTRWIIDYKTADVDQTLKYDAFLASEENKYREKMQRYAHALHKLHPGPIKLALYFPALPAWREWQFDQ